MSNGKVLELTNMFPFIVCSPRIVQKMMISVKRKEIPPNRQYVKRKRLLKIKQDVAC
jgi:hypothetical protein